MYIPAPPRYYIRHLYGGFMIAAPPCALIRSLGHIYAFITNVNNTYVLVIIYSIYYKYVSN